MIELDSIEDVACLKGSDDLIQKVNEILSLIRDKGGKGEIKRHSFVLEKNVLYFNLAINIPVEVKTPERNEQSS